MKKICFMAGLLFFSAVGFAQQQRSRTIQANDSIVKIETTSSKRTTKPEIEMDTLTTSQKITTKHLWDIQPQLPATEQKKKLVVNRVGSKQLIWKKE